MPLNTQQHPWRRVSHVELTCVILRHAVCTDALSTCAVMSSGPGERKVARDATAWSARGVVPTVDPQGLVRLGLRGNNPVGPWYSVGQSPYVERRGSVNDGPSACPQPSVFTVWRCIHSLKAATGPTQRRADPGVGSRGLSVRTDALVRVGIDQQVTVRGNVRGPLRPVPPPVVEAATGIGMPGRRRLRLSAHLIGRRRVWRKVGNSTITTITTIAGISGLGWPALHVGRPWVGGKEAGGTLASFRCHAHDRWHGRSAGRLLGPADSDGVGDEVEDQSHDQTEKPEQCPDHRGKPPRGPPQRPAIVLRKAVAEHRPQTGERQQ